MKPNCKRHVIALTLASACWVPTALARPSSDRPTAIVDFPYIVTDFAQGIDTTVQLTNSSEVSPVTVLCRWLNSDSYCTNAPSQVCTASSQCPAGGTCVQGYSRIDFRFTLTPGQPLVFSAYHGESHLACDPSFSPPPSCLGAAQGQIVPVPQDPFIGRLQCLTIDAGTQAPTEENVLRGEATIEHFQVSPAVLDAARYNAIGLAALPGTNDGDDTLLLGQGGEYEACPFSTSVTHFFENALEPSTGSSHIFTRLIVAPCSYDPTTPTPGHVTVDYLVFNEFEQRLAVRKAFNGLQFGRLSSVDPMAWDVGVQGTLAGQTRMANVTDNNGFLVLAVEEQEAVADPSRIASAATNPYTQGDRFTLDVVGGAGTCGNGLVEPGEECDDGNLAANDGCDGACRTEVCYVCEGSPSVCGPPALCSAPGTSSVLIDDSPTNDADNKFVWHWDDGSLDSPIDNPAVVTDYTLCVYDGAQIVMHAAIQHGGTCGSRPCWKVLGTKGFHYKNSNGNADGFTVATLKQVGMTQHITVIGKGANVPLPGPVSATRYFSQSPRVTVAMFKSATKECWQSDFLTSAKNTSTKFKAGLP
jgi:cysteine-rich repeat protein